MTSIADVSGAARTLDGVVNATPTLTSTTLDSLLCAQVFLKAECFQRTGSFKFRGAYHLISGLPPDQLDRGICTVSSGNHAQAVALAAQLLGTQARILMPSDAPEVKAAATAGYGAIIETYDRWSTPQAEAGRLFQERDGGTFIPAYDDPRIASGAGTAALELWHSAGPLDILLAPIGGGGGMAGWGTVAKALSPNSQVIGVESDRSAVTKLSLAQGQRQSIELKPHLADGQMLETPGSYTFDVMRKVVDDVVLVSDMHIVEAMGFLFERFKVVAEPSGAITLAALLSGQVDTAGKRVGVMISGGNCGTRRFAELVDVQR